jgi:hypothetical protein
MITQDEDTHLPSAKKENVLPINHDTPGRGMMRSIVSGNQKSQAERMKKGQGKTRFKMFRPGGEGVAWFQLTRLIIARLTQSAYLPLLWR